MKKEYMEPIMVEPIIGPLGVDIDPITASGQTKDPYEGERD